eukprot:TRINITY_DN3920_c0_g1_i4.p1 TRINITY_DN3920_c0_g1~~TRINITY_DN3920_c0_g1_i4.p1  ORF type:complete len:188 (+),score=39.64 TRINITY_DN3920_c0_g1_i4:38-601(+)
MASAISLQGFSFGLHTNRSLNPLRFSVNSISINPSLSSPNSALGSRENTPKFKFKHIIYKASLEGVPSELVEDPKFVPLNAEDPRYGPPALLLLGFEAGEIVKIQQLLQELDGEFLKIAKSLPRICFLSGLSGEEMMMFIDAFPGTGLEPAVFAALVPNSANKPLVEVMEEIMGDHEMMSAKQSNPS